MSVAAYSDIVEGPLALFLKHSQAIGGEVAAQAQHVHKLFQAQLQFLTHVAQSQPPSQSNLMTLLEPMAQHIATIQEIRERCRRSQLFNHLSAISESIPALGWVAIRLTPVPFLKEMIDVSHYFTNRVLSEWKEKNNVHVEWVKVWIQTLTDLQQFVKQHHTTGLVWGLKAGAGALPSPSPGIMTLPSSTRGDSLSVEPNQNRSALFNDINKGEAITSVLKRVTQDTQIRNNSERVVPSLTKTPSQTSELLRSAGKLKVNKHAEFSKDGRKIIVENQKRRYDLMIDRVEMKNVVYMYKCEDSTLTIKGKLSSVVLDSCRKVSIVVDTVVSSIEFINCQSVQMQVLGKVPTITIDKTDGCQMYLSQESIDVEIVSSKSSEMNVMIPKGDGDYKEQPIPEQCKTTISHAKLTTVAVEYKN